MVDLKLQIDPSFYVEEVRCDYTVSEEMKKVSAVELDLVAEFQRVCEKYGLVYFADGGTMLGTVRHKGFIPWDDDIDLMMMRDQYDKLCEVAPKEFKDPYFFQTEYTDPSSLRGHAQLRNSDTTGISKAEMEGVHKFNQGMFIDIFPVDAVPDDDALLEKMLKNIARNLLTARKLAAISDVYSPAPKNKVFRNAVKKTLYTIFSGPGRRFIDYDKYYDRYEKECRKYNSLKTKRVAKYFFVPFMRSQIWMREDFDSSIPMQFEMLELPVPVGYKRIMDTFFGKDWMTPKKVATTHFGVFYDVNKSYRDYLEEKK